MDFTFSQTRPPQSQWHVCHFDGLSTISTNAHSVPGDHQGQVQGCVTYQVMSLQRCAEAFPSLKGQFFSCTSWGAAKRSFGNFMEHELHTKHPVCMISLQQPWGNGCSEAPLQVRKLALRELSASPRGCKLHEGRGQYHHAWHILVLVLFPICHSEVYGKCAWP